MPRLDKFSLSNFSIDGGKSGVESGYFAPYANNAGLTWTGGANNMAPTFDIATIPAGTRVLNIAPMGTTARMTIRYSTGGNVQMYLALADANGVIWRLMQAGAGPGNDWLSFMQVSIKIDMGAAYSTYVIDTRQVGETVQWLATSSVTRPSNFNPDAGPMKLGVGITGNTGTATGTLYMQYFWIVTG
ncbi:hypothetical protein [Paenibacillus sp. O199]|uniref:hypothetical protein n=1 Tax=Paenibacillus sp. O199 TaxID=1643925 RepID=UPI0007BFC199|nr:hypothetical protein [Paenibacillus sp. O199]